MSTHPETTFVTGATGYLGSYVVNQLLSEYPGRLALLVRAKDPDEAKRRLWRSLQLHMDFERFCELLTGRVDVYLGDITASRLGLSEAAYDRLAGSIDSVLHIAASLNRKSEKACLNVNLRGTLEVIKLARAAHGAGGLRRFSDVSTTAVAGERMGEHIEEDAAIDWDRNDYDPYARSKKFCEHMVHELLPEVPKSVLRPSMVIGDSRFGETTQFDMVGAFAFLARLPLIPIEPSARIDTVPADYVSRGAVAVHMADSDADGIYHLSSGEGSLSAAEIVSGLRVGGQPLKGRLRGELSAAAGNLSALIAATPRAWGAARFGMMMKVFWPYITFDTVFDNRRIVEVLGAPPPRVTAYMSATLDFAIDHGFAYPYRPWPEGAAGPEVWVCQA